MNRTFHKVILLGLVAMLLTMASVALAQEGEGQLCVRAFEDRNRDGVRDTGEPFLVDGISANLLNEDGIIINTALLSQSQRRSEGLVCFQRLMPDVYTVQVVSADYLPTSAEQVTLTIGESSIPQVFEYGAELIVVEAPVVAEETPRTLEDAFTPARLQRLLFAAIGAAVVMGFFIVIGVMAWFLFIRPRTPQQPVTGAYAPVPGTGQYPPVQTPSPSTSGRFRPVTPPTGTMPVVSDDTDLPPDDDVERYQPPS